MKVLTLTARFPSLVQPWLVNHLVEIIANGGENVVFCGSSDLDCYTDNIRRYGLDKQYYLISALHRKRTFDSLSFLIKKKDFLWGQALKNLLDIWRSADFSLKEKILSITYLPFVQVGRVDIIHSHSEPAGNRLLPIVKAVGAPLVVTFHGLPPVGVKPLTLAHRERYLSYASVLLVNTQFAKKQYESLGAPSEKIQIIPQGIILESFPFRVRSYHPEVLNVLTVGRFHPDKGQEYALKAVAELIHSGVNICYRLVGNGPDRGRLEALASELNIKQFVEFYSKVSDEKLRSLYNQSEVFILPSLSSQDGFHEETQGVVLQEAQAMGLIVIATQVGGIPECIDNGVSGFLVRDRNSSEIAEAVRQLIQRADDWPSIQKAGRRWVEQRYDMKKIGVKMNALYQSLLQ